MELIGRARELGLLDRALDEVRAGGTRAVAIVGEAGIGKSALLDALAARAAPLRVLTGRAAEHEREVPFALAVDAFDAPAAALAPQRLEAVGAGLPACFPSRAETRLRRGRSAACAPTARSRRCSGSSRASAPSRCCSTTCTGPTTRRWSCSTISSAARPTPRTCSCSRPVRALACLTSRVLALEPLDRDASLALVGARAAVARRSRTPRAATRCSCASSRGRGDGLPGSLVAAVRRETASLDAAAAALLAGAAVAGDPFDPELAAAAAGVAPDAAALDVLCARDLVRPTGDGRLFAFRHPLVRRCVYDALPPARPARRARAGRRRARRARRRAGGAGVPRRALRAGRRPGRDRGAARRRRSGRPHRAGHRRALVRRRAAAARRRAGRARRPARADGVRARRCRALRRRPRGAGRGVRARRRPVSSRSPARGSTPSSGATPTRAGACCPRRTGPRSRSSSRRSPTTRAV